MDFYFIPRVFTLSFYKTGGASTIKIKRGFILYCLRLFSIF